MFNIQGDQFYIWQCNSQNDPVKAEFRYLYISGCFRLVKLCTLRLVPLQDILIIHFIYFIIYLPFIALIIYLDIHVYLFNYCTNTSILT
jgi:hypothetical protein